MEITPRYSVVPHGVRRVDTGIFAAFKMVVSVREFEDDNTDTGQITKAEWESFISKVNRRLWSHSFKLRPGRSALLEFKGTDNVDERRVESLNTSEERVYFQTGFLSRTGSSDQIFQYGIDALTRKQQLNFFDEPVEFLKTVDREPAPTIGQFQQNFNPTGEYTYTSVLTRARNYAAGRQITVSQQGKLDFKQVYYNIMNDPNMAETKFALIREILIPMEKLVSLTDLDTATKQVPYQVRVDNEDSNSITFLLWKQGLKYYNGLESLFFQNSDFAQVRFFSYDLYKKHLEEGQEKSKPHPDGIYVNVAYKMDQGSIVDPFTAKGLKGFNVVVRDSTYNGRNPWFNSLSYHERSYVFPKTSPDEASQYTHRTSGTLSPRTEILVSDSAAVRTNALFVWRGDNLFVNRDSEHDDENKEDDDKTTNTEEKKPLFKSAAEVEEQFANEYFQRSESLVEGSQNQLLNGYYYYFILRRVGNTEHCIPLLKEIDAETAGYTLTVDDLLGAKSELQKYALNDPACMTARDPGRYHFSVAKDIPIRSVKFVGKKKFDDPNSGFVDTSNHMVLNAADGERNEKRFIFPPSIKFEDFRVLGHLKKNALLTAKEFDITNPKNISPETFANRCVRLEKLSANKAPSLAFWRTKINYLADPRGTFLFFRPADLFTRNSSPVMNPFQVFFFNARFPYIRRTRSGRLKVKCMEAYSGTPENYRYQLFFNASKNYFMELRQGVYLFDVFIFNRQFDQADAQVPNDDDPQKWALFNSAQLRISLVDKPVKPDMQITSTTFILTLLAQRHEQVRQSQWFFEFSVTQRGYWQSLKFVEQTEVLDLSRTPRNSSLMETLFNNEYPYFQFVVTSGDVDSTKEFNTGIFPAEVRIFLSVRSTTLNANETVASIKLSESESLYAKLDGATTLKLFLNDVQISTGSQQNFSLDVKFSAAQNRFEISGAGLTSTVSLQDPVSAEISVRDAEIFGGVGTDARSEILLSVERSEKYVFLTDLRNRYAARKTIRLFASSAYQAYFPKEKSEAPLGTLGSTHDFFIPNNIKPETPVVSTDILFMYTTDQKWREGRTEREKSKTTQTLLWLTLPQDFMKEDRNKLGIIVRNITDTNTTNVSLAGDDITHLSREDFSGNHFIDFLAADNRTLTSLLSKYLGQSGLTRYKIGTRTYEVLECTPYYNTALKKWQVVLAVTSLNSAEAIFVKLVTVKIARGLPMKDVADNAKEDVTNTNLSDFSEPSILPIYNQRTITLTKKGKGFQIRYNGPEIRNRKLFCVFMAKKRFMFSQILSDGSLTENLLEFECESAENRSGKILMFAQTTIDIKLRNKAVFVLELELFDNYSGGRYATPRFIEQNPLFEMRGVRLINVAEMSL